MKIFNFIGYGVGKTFYFVKHPILSVKALVEGNSKLLKDDEKFEILSDPEDNEDYIDDYTDDLEESDKKESQKKFFKIPFKGMFKNRNKLLKDDEKFEILSDPEDNEDYMDDEDYIDDYTDDLEESDKKESQKKFFKNPFKNMLKNKNKLFKDDAVYDEFYDMSIDQKKQRKIKEEIDSVDLNNVDILDYISVYLSDTDISDKERLDLQKEIQKLLDNPNKEKELRKELKNIKDVMGNEKYYRLTEVIGEINVKKRRELIYWVTDYLMDFQSDTPSIKLFDELYDNIVKIVDKGKENELKKFIKNHSDVNVDLRYDLLINEMFDIIDGKLEDDDTKDKKVSNNNVSDLLKSIQAAEEMASQSLGSCDKEIEKAKASLKSNDIFAGMDEEIEELRNADRKSKTNDNKIIDSDVIEVDPIPVTEKIRTDRKSKSNNNEVIDTDVIEINPMPVTEKTITDRKPKLNNSEIVDSNDIVINPIPVNGDNINNEETKIKITYVTEKNSLPYVALSGMNIDKLNEILNKNVLNECELISLKSELVNLKNRYNGVTSESIAENYRLVMDAIEEKLGLSDKKTIVLNYVSLNGINMDKLIELLNKDKLNECELISLKSELVNLKNRYNGVTSESIAENYKLVMDAMENKLTM